MMGIFSFVKGAGTKIFGAGRDPADELYRVLTGNLKDQVQNLEVAFDDGLITISGSCDSQATKEKAILIAGNIQDVEQVDADQLMVVQGEAEAAAPAPAEAAGVSEFYTIQSGDSLSKVAKHFYGDPMKYTALFEANKEVIKDVNKIYPGQVIRIPKL